ncbi:MAG: hypothetical protein GXO32_00065 [Crenarchaeota archaeon]|nr:hypothetical protein [Thermoproteota archaeon]
MVSGAALERVRGVVEEVIDALDRWGELVLEAYPGFGKTLLGVEVLKRFRRGVMVVRTRMEMDVAVRMARGLGYRLAPLYGRMTLCPRGFDGDPNLFSALCRARRLVGECVERADGEALNLCSRASGLEELREIGRSRGFCPFRAHVISSLSSGRIVTTYEFLYRHPEVCSRVRDWDVAVLDECHALVEDAERLVVRIDREFVWGLAEALKRVDPRACYALRALSRRWGEPSEVIDVLEKVVESCGDRCSELERVVDGWRKGLAYVDRSSGAIYVATEPRLDVGSRRLLTTAYLPPPLARGRRVLKIEPREKRVRVIVDTSITTRFRERGPNFVDELAKAIARHVDRNVANLVVVPSKAIAERVSMELALRGYSVAPPEAIERASEGTVIIDVAGGRATEGVTPSKSLRRVVVAGMPYPPPSPELSALAKLWGFEAVYTYRALLRTVQALGRLTRWGGVGVLIDRRFARYVDRLPPWIEVEDVS